MQLNSARIVGDKT